MIQQGLVLPFVLPNFFELEIGCSVIIIFNKRGTVFINFVKVLQRMAAVISFSFVSRGSIINFAHSGCLQHK